MHSGAGVNDTYRLLSYYFTLHPYQRVFYQHRLNEPHHGFPIIYILRVPMCMAASKAFSICISGSYCVYYLGLVRILHWRVTL